MTSVGIVGTGISGLNLALTLQQAGVDTTVYAEHAPDELRHTRLPNSATRFGPAVASERALGVEHWADCASNYAKAHVSILGTPIAFSGALQEPASALDFRVYLPRLLEDYAERGGNVVVGRRGPDDVVAGIDEHDLTVVASGRDSINAFFPRDAQRSRFTAPQRIICATAWSGIAPADPAGVDICISPGVGEIFMIPMRMQHGIVAGMTMESVPGGPMEALARMRYDDDPAAFDALGLDLLRRYAPTVYERVDHAAFGLTGPLDVLQGALTPTVRRPFCEVTPGRFVVAVGDAYVLNDPIAGQGANLGSRSAAILAEAICRDVAFDEWFCRGVARDMWAAAEPVTNFTNSFFSPPAPHVNEILAAATAQQSVADAFANLYADPVAAWRALATADRAAAFLAAHDAPPSAIAA